MPHPLTRIRDAHTHIQRENKVVSDGYKVFLRDHLIDVEEAERLVACKCEENSQLSSRCSEVKFENQQMEHQVRKLEVQLSEAKADEEKKRSMVSKLKGEILPKSSNEFPKMKESILLYKKVSGIKWAYSESPCVMSGFITDKSHGKLQPFTYNTRENSHSYIYNSLWRHVEKHAKPFIVEE